ncbi:MAG: transposase [Granulosicoccus sp.]
MHSWPSVAWGRSSEKHPGQSELSLFNEAELVAMRAPIDDDDTADKDPNTEAAPTKPKKPGKRRVPPDHLERVRVVHELDEEHRQSPCGGTWVRIGEELTEQIGVIPARQLVIQHVKIKYACTCKG